MLKIHGKTAKCLEWKISGTSTCGEFFFFLFYISCRFSFFEQLKFHLKLIILSGIFIASCIFCWNVKSYLSEHEKQAQRRSSANDFSFIALKFCQLKHLHIKWIKATTSSRDLPLLTTASSRLTETSNSIKQDVLSNFTAIPLLKVF